MDFPLFALTLCMLGNFCCRLLTFFKINFLKKSFRNSIRLSNGLDPDQDRHFVGPDLGPKCLQRLSADGKSHELKKGTLTGIRDNITDHLIPFLQQV